MAVIGGFDRANHLSELDDPIESQGEGVLSPATRRTRMVQNLLNDSSLTGSQAKNRLTSPGFIPLDITALREIATNDIQDLAAHGGLLASDSDPSLARVNGATDKALRVVWDTSADTDEVQFPPVFMPPDLDAGSDLTIHLLAKMGGTTDTPTIDVQVFDGIGDTEMGGATAALSDTLAELTVTVDAANISGHPTGFLNISLVPAAHTNDALELYAAWIEYTKS